MKVALVYDRLNKWGGAERVLIVLNKLFPHATWYTSVWDPRSAPFSKSWDVRTSWLNQIPLLRNRHEWIPYLMPFIFESFDFSGFDLVISVSSEAAKGVITRPGTIHLNYCLTPTRYLWSHREHYTTNNQFGLLQRLVAPLGRKIMDYLAKWDLVASTRPDKMISISTSVKTRIKKYYNRDASVIFPPVDTKKLAAAASLCHRVNDYYLVVSRLVSYKKVEVVVSAFNILPDRKLVIVGTGCEEKRLKKLARSNISFVRSVEDRELIRYYANCRGVVQANIEDFGLVMVEAQACGKPVIARRGGGAQDIIVHGQTGLLYDGKGAAALTSAIKQFETMSFDSKAIQKNASRFDTHIWEAQIKERVQALCQQT